MNIKLQNYARQEIKNGLAKLEESHRNLFMRMYSPDNLEADIDDVVESMISSKLDHALTQVENSLKKQPYK